MNPCPSRKSYLPRKQPGSRSRYRGTGSLCGRRIAARCPLFDGNAHARTSGMYTYKDERKRPDRIKQPARNGDANRRVARKKVRDLAFPFRVLDEFGRRGSSGRNRKEAASSAAR